HRRWCALHRLALLVRRAGTAAHAGGAAGAGRGCGYGGGMNQRLSGERIALFESRLAAEISELVRRTGAVPICVPAVRGQRRPAAEEVAALLGEVEAEASPVFVFSTGVGASALFEEARALGRGAELRDAISRGLSVCRGPKPVAALHKEGIAASRRAQAPYTTQEFIAALAEVDLRDRMVVLVHYGE